MCCVFTFGEDLCQFNVGTADLFLLRQSFDRQLRMAFLNFFKQRNLLFLNVGCLSDQNF